MRLPRTIWRHILAEMWRLLLLTAAVLVAVTAFAVTVRYTAEGKLGPLETLRFMGLAAVPMLQYVLPFAAGFGATLAYHRMTQENELTAAKASGVSHRALLAPALLTGVALAAVLWGLNGWIIPRFLRSMEQMIALDAARLVAKSIESGRPLEFGGRIVYADRVYNVTPESPQRGGPREVLVLSGVLALDLGPNREV
ncbi:MAG: LptF/LptG family permease, partial [Phycisphaerales bacterium]